MSSATRAFASVADFQQLEAHWNESQMGQLVADEAMRPFVDDMKAQIERKLNGARQKLGLTPDDLKEVAAGEIAFGMVERNNARAAIVVTVDVTGKLGEAEALLAKIDGELAKRGGRSASANVSGVKLTTYQIPPQSEKDIAREAAFFVHQDLFVACDSRLEAEEILRRFGAGPGDRLADVEAYQETMRQCAAESGNLAPEVRWFVDPFGYARAAKSLLTGEAAQRRGKDYVAIFQSQGFDAIQGIGGFVNLSVMGAFELLHRTSVYAPALPGEPNKYKLAMQIMRFPNSAELDPQRWIPRKLASYRTFNCDLQNAYDHLGTLFDAIAGYDDAFRDMIEGLETDPYGPQVKVRDEFISHLGGRVTLMTDYEVPITTKSERFAFIVDVKNEAAVQAAIEKFMKADPNAHRREFAGKVVWEILPPESDVPELDLAIEPVSPSDGGGGKALSTSAVCVTEGHLIVASHLEFLERILAEKPTGESLAEAGDYHEVDAAMSQLFHGPAAARCFVRTDEAYRPTYELLRQGKMPESETLLGRLLNRLLTTPEDEDEGVLRKQKIDGRQLPHFEMVRRYFSPAGTVVRSNDTGWFIVGATLTKQSPQARAGAAIPANGVSSIR